MANILAKFFSLCLIASCSILQAVELSDFKLDLTREKADEALDKNYEYQVLRDATVRRTWTMKNRAVSLDFLTKEDKLICITLRYTKPAPAKICVQDAEKLTGEELRQWRAVNDDICSKLGLKKAMGCQTANGSYVFRERDSEGKCSVMIFYTAKPEKDRHKIAVFEGVKNSALGSTAEADLTFLMEDEYARKANLAAKLNAPVDKVDRDSALGSTSKDGSTTTAVQKPTISNPALRFDAPKPPGTAKTDSGTARSTSAQGGAGEAASSAASTTQPEEKNALISATDPIFQPLGMGGLGGGARIAVLVIAIFLILVLPLILVSKSSQQKKVLKPKVFPAGAKPIRPLNKPKRK